MWKKIEKKLFEKKNDCLEFFQVLFKFCSIFVSNFSKSGSSCGSGSGLKPAAAAGRKLDLVVAAAA